VHDDMVWTAGPFMKPDWYREFVFPNFKKYFAPLKDAGKILCFTSDGNYTEFLPDLVECGVNCFVFEPMVDMKGFAETYGQTHSFVGNADTRILLSNNKAAIRAEVERCMAIGKDCPGYIMCVGNHIPPNTPVEAAMYYNDVYMELRER
jgi:uroporphyrinogen-III decarboxylase